MTNDEFELDFADRMFESGYRHGRAKAADAVEKILDGFGFLTPAERESIINAARGESERSGSTFATQGIIACPECGHSNRHGDYCSCTAREESEQ